MLLAYPNDGVVFDAKQFAELDACHGFFKRDFALEAIDDRLSVGLIEATKMDGDRELHRRGDDTDKTMHTLAFPSCFFCIESVAIL